VIPAVVVWQDARGDSRARLSRKATTRTSNSRIATNLCHPERSMTPTKWTSCAVEGPLFSEPIVDLRGAFLPLRYAWIASVQGHPSDAYRGDLR
jgi:hypothetical protein